jgi:ketosteroid isomerase-like protein
MSDKSPLELVQQMYAAFGQGNVAAMQALITEDFEWDSRYSAGVPLGGLWRGHDGLLEFLKTVGETVDALAFETQEFIAQDNKVVALGFDESRAKSTGWTCPGFVEG